MKKYGTPEKNKKINKEEGKKREALTIYSLSRKKLH